jgi:hypothetical protein
VKSAAGSHFDTTGWKDEFLIRMFGRELEERGYKSLKPVKIMIPDFGHFSDVD